ncbi:MAG: endonuclease MutS2, partial [Bacilli bacterium]
MLQRTLRVLEWPQIKEKLQQFAATELATHHIEKLEPSFEYEEVLHRLAETDEAWRLYMRTGSIPLHGLVDITPFIKRSLIGSVLAGVEVSQVLKTIVASKQIEEFITSAAENDVSVPKLLQVISDLYVLPQLERTITTCIDEEGNVYDDASTELRAIRHRLRTAERRLKEKLDSIVRSSSMLTEQIVTVRNDRYVVPVRHDMRTTFKGIVHDQSSSGQTLFMEPEAIVPLNNELHALKMEESREIYRIMSELTEQIAAHADALTTNNALLGHLDFTFSKARLAKAMRATCPQMLDKPAVHLKRAYHPLLDERTVVKNDILLEESVRTLVITGPNTGGKTVT